MKLSTFPVFVSLILTLASCGGTAQETTAPGSSPSQTSPSQEAAPGKEAAVPEISGETREPQSQEEPTSSESLTTTAERTASPNRPGTDAPAAYQGEVTFSSGPTALYRDGQVYRDLEPGKDIQPLDLLETGAEGQLEIDLRGPGVPGVLVSLSPRSQFYLENSLLGNNQKTTVHLLAGRAVLTVNKLLGGAVGLQTSEAALSVRGTVFTVVIAPTQDILVTCSEGSVEVTRGSAKQIAAPGKVVFHAPGETLDALDVRVDKLGAFEDRWSDILAQELEVLARVQLKDFARTFPQRLGIFEARFRELENLKPTLDRWRALAAQNRRPDLNTLVMDKKVVAPTLLNLKKSLFFLERQVAWLLTLEGALSPRFQASDLDGRTVKTVMNLALSQKDYLQAKFSRVRFAMALFAQMDPESPLGEFLTDLDQGEDVFAPLPGAGAQDVLSR